MAHAQAKEHQGNGVHAAGLGGRLRLGTRTILGLAVLTALEFWIAVDWPRSALIAGLVIIALIKAWLIVQYFMHAKQLWRSEE